MITLDDLKNFDLKQLDPTKLDLTRFDIRNVELPTFDFPEVELPFDLPNVEFPSLELPKFEMPEIDLPVEIDRLTSFARDAAYVGVGAVVVTAQKADERRRELTDQVTTRIRKVVGAAA